ncbi:UNVERIFIED_ORG: glycosyltransferase involved in cell wall biosynthesis [Burkholderia sp. 1263]
MAVYDVPHGFSRKFLLWYRFCFAMLPRMDPTILTVSMFSKARICEHLKIAESRVSVVTPGADHLDRVVSDASITERLGLEKDAYCVIVGSLDARKNLQRVLDAVGRLKHRRDIRFVVVGGRNPRIFGNGSVSSSTNAEQVIWAGFVSDGELKALYGNAGCLIFPSLYEGFGLPPLEAMYCGCPVIASTRTSIPEACGDAAMYCDATSVDDIAEKISLMMTDEALRQRYRAKGLLHAREYRWDRSAQKLLDILQGRASDSLASLAPNVSAG